MLSGTRTGVTKLRLSFSRVTADKSAPWSLLLRYLFCHARCVWPTTSEGASGTSGITITVESEKGSTTSLDSIVSKPSSKLSPGLLKRLRAVAGKVVFSGIKSRHSTLIHNLLQKEH